MNMETPHDQPREKYLRTAFRIGLIIKAIDGVLQTLAGFAFYFLSKNFLIDLVRSYAREELLEDPKDFMATHLIGLAEQFSISSQHFVALYLVVHGIVKLALIIALLRNKRWAYPVSIAVFGGFIIYELYRLSSGYSVWLLIAMALDAIVVGLTIHEYRYMKRNREVADNK
jgi:uncharacterized membrane protein